MRSNSHWTIEQARSLNTLTARGTGAGHTSLSAVWRTSERAAAGARIKQSNKCKVCVFEYNETAQRRSPHCEAPCARPTTYRATRSSAKQAQNSHDAAREAITSADLQNIPKHAVQRAAQLATNLASVPCRRSRGAVQRPRAPSQDCHLGRLRLQICRAQTPDRTCTHRN